MASTGEWSSPVAESALGLVLACAACTPVDWQLEKVLGDDLGAIEIEGDELSGLGSTLALGAQGLLVGAEGSGRIHAFDLSGRELWCAAGTPGVGMRLGWTDEGAWTWQRGIGFRFFSDTGALISEEIETEATAVDRCPDGSFEAVLSPGAALSCSESGLLWTECSDGGCDLLQDGELIARTSPGCLGQCLKEAGVSMMRID